MKRQWLLLFLLAILFTACQPKQEPFARQLGTVSAFSELINAGVKQLALSSVMSEAEMDEFYPLAKAAAAEYNVEVWRETDLLVTDLFPADVASGKEVLILYQGLTIDAYNKIKTDQQALKAANDYNEANRVEISRRFGRLLSYSPRKINALIAEQTDFRTLDDFGIKATNVFLYYKDLPRATAFYTETLGLELLAEYDNASIVRIAAESYLILVDAAKGMHAAEEPKTVALALLTDQLPAWYAHVQEQGVPIKYTYKPREGGPHDGFVAIDPEGYLLEFEEFKQHKENEKFMTFLDTNEHIETSVSRDGEPLSFFGAITWLYYKDVLAMQGFYEDVMGLELVADQGWTKIYRATDSGFIGLVDERRGMHKFSQDKGVTVSFILDDLDGWFNYVQQKQPFALRSEEIGTGPDGKYRAFVGFDPENYFLEFDKFYPHEVNTTLMKYLNPD